MAIQDRRYAPTYPTVRYDGKNFAEVEEFFRAYPDSSKRLVDRGDFFTVGPAYPDPPPWDAPVEIHPGGGAAYMPQPGQVINGANFYGPAEFARLFLDTTPP